MNGKTIIGPLLVLLGIFLLFNDFGSIGPGRLIGYFWPTLFVIPLGIMFHWLFFRVTERRASGLLIPGGVLLTAGIVCQISMLFGNWEYTWPGFILAPAIGLFEFYWFGTRNKWLLIPINILTVLSLLFFTLFSIGSLFNTILFGQPVIAVVLILCGILMLFMRSKQS